MSYHIKKEVKFGPKYVEHIYGSHPEIWSGTWMKVLYILIFIIFIQYSDSTAIYLFDH